MRRAHKLRRGHSPALWHAASVPTPPVQDPSASHISGFEQGAVQMESLAHPGSDQLPNHDPMPAFDHIVVDHEPPLPVNTADPEVAVAQETDERLVERVREVVPDVLPAHVFELLAQHKTAFSDILLDVIIHNLLEDKSYPRDTKGKGKERAVEEKKLPEIFGDHNMSIDYTHPNANKPVGPAYRVLSLVCINSLLLRSLLICKQKYLYTNFPDVDKTYILEALSLHEGHYAPTYLHLLQHGATPTSVVPVAPKAGKRRRKANGKSSLNEEDLVTEHIWLVEELENRRNASVLDPLPQAEEEEGGDIECGCCFSSYPFVCFSEIVLLSYSFLPQSKMAQCMDTHLFCTSCVTSYASARLGEQNSDLRCMDISGCKMSFSDSELRRVLPEKLFALYEHIRQRRDIELAGLEGLEECPFCDFKVVMDVDFQADKVLRCQNEECGKVSCRKCKVEVSICIKTWSF
jgi:E3 ubiquitin-protein ligase RNF216